MPHERFPDPADLLPDPAWRSDFMHAGSIFGGTLEKNGT
jgi:hypothetical protein